MSYDPRTIANIVLRYGKRSELKITNFSVNKVVFFLHGHFLAHTKAPLISEQFEAWKHGPVLCTLFQCFKKYGDQPITSVAQRMDYSTGKLLDVDEPLKADEVELLEQYLPIYTRASVSQLYEWSHASGGPWDKTWNHRSPSNPGMIIANQAIAEYFAMEDRIHGGFRA